MSNLDPVNVAYIEAQISAAKDYGDSGAPPDPYTGFEVVDTGANIRTLPPSNLQFFFTNEYKSTEGPLAFTVAQAAALAAYASNAHEALSFSAPPGASLQNLLALTPDQLSELHSLGLTATAVEIASIARREPGSVGSYGPNEALHHALRQR